MKTWIAENQILSFFILIAVIIGAYYLVKYLMSIINKPTTEVDKNKVNIHDVNSQTSTMAKGGSTHSAPVASGLHGTVAGQTRAGASSAGMGRTSNAGVRH